MLEGAPGDAAFIQIEAGVVELALLHPRRADEDRRGAVAGVAREFLDRFAGVLLQRRLQHQIFRRIADDEELGKQDQIGALLGGLCARGARPGEIAGNIAHQRIELRQRNAKPVDHG